MLDSPFIKEALSLALREDLALGDVTTRLTVDDSVRAIASLKAKQSLITCGLAIVPALVETANMQLGISMLKNDGDAASPGETLVTLTGKANDLLSLERTLLNVVQRMCAVATQTKKVTQHLTKMTVLDTRKTAPCFRMFDKYAVLIGGGKNHRTCLGDMILVKNNHVDCQKGATRAIRMKTALDKIIARKPPYLSFEVEVRDFDELTVAVEYGPTVIMLDNFAIETIPHALATIHKKSPRSLVEVSGGITPERCVVLEELGVQYVSMGALTHSVEAVDISLAIEPIVSK